MNPQEKQILNEGFWENRYQTEQTGWDIGCASPALVEYMKQVENKESSILIPGAGNAHELQALLDLGFKDITILDIAETPINKLKNQFQGEEGVQLIQEDFFEFEGKYDYVLEQTFFCALSPTLRPKYVQKMQDLLKDGGKLVGVLFNTEFEKDGPPFGGTKEEYEALFKDAFSLQTMEECYLSIPPRENNELFIIMKNNASINKIN